MRVNPYQIAWKDLEESIKTVKTNWGRNELLNLMKDKLLEAFEGVEEAEEDEG
jgi:hypothetical protein